MPEITIIVTDQELEVINTMANKQEITPSRLMRSALAVYQARQELIEGGFVKELQKKAQPDKKYDPFR